MSMVVSVHRAGVGISGLFCYCVLPSLPPVFHLELGYCGLEALHVVLILQHVDRTRRLPQPSRRAVTPPPLALRVMTKGAECDIT